MNHVIKHINIAPQVETDLGGFAVNQALETTILEELAHIAAGERPNANGFAHFFIDIASDLVGEYALGIMALPRAYSPSPNERVGWAVAVLTEAQVDLLRRLPFDEISGYLVNFLGLEGAAARYWTKVY